MTTKDQTGSLKSATMCWFKIITWAFNKFLGKKYCIGFVYLRVVQTQAILFLESMSEIDESDIQRRWNWMRNFQIDSETIEDDIIPSPTMSDPPLSDIDFRNKMAWVWTTLKFFDREPP